MRRISSAPKLPTGLVHIRLAPGAIALSRLVKDLSPAFQTHFFTAACQFITTVNAALVWAGNVGPPDRTGYR